MPWKTDLVDSMYWLHHMAQGFLFIIGEFFDQKIQNYVLGLKVTST